MLQPPPASAGVLGLVALAALFGGALAASMRTPSARTPSARGAFAVACLVVGSKAADRVAADLAFEPALWAGGFGTVLVLDRQVGAAMCEASCDAVVYSASSLGALGAPLAGCTKPLLTWEEGFYRASGMSGPAGGADASCGRVDGTVTIEGDSPLAAGLSGTVRLFDGPQDMSWAARSSLGPGARVVATQAAAAERAVVFYYCRGARQHAGVPAPNLRIGLPPHYFPGSPPVAWTANGTAVLRLAVAMLADAVADADRVRGCEADTAV
jgi:hypothetical protein